MMEPLCICGHGLSYHQWADSQKANCDNCACAKYTAQDDSDRHPKRHEDWQKVEPGTVIPAGQPYRIEFNLVPSGAFAHERVHHSDVTVPDESHRWFVDSSWRPPLVLPTEPTWGIAVNSTGTVVTVGKWHTDPKFGFKNEEPWHYWPIERVGDFIPLTEEQVQRIEQAR